MLIPYRRRPAAVAAVAPWVVSAIALAAAPSATRPAQPPAARVSFATEDGVVIVGDYAPAVPRRGEKPPVAILLHDAGADRSAWKALVPALQRGGFATLAIDLRGHGESIEPPALRLRQKAQARDAALFRAMYKDVAAAYVWLAGQDEVDLARFAIIGNGVGGSLALESAGRDRSVDAIVCVSPTREEHGPSATAAVRKCEGRSILIIAARADDEFAHELQRIAPKATLKAVSPATTGTAPADGGAGLLERAGDLDKTLLAFLESSVGRPAKDPVVATVNGEVYHVPGSSHAQRIKEENRRWYSSAAEAEARGLRPVKKRTARTPGGSSGRGTNSR